MFYLTMHLTHFLFTLFRGSIYIYMYIYIYTPCLPYSVALRASNRFLSSTVDCLGVTTLFRFIGGALQLSGIMAFSGIIFAGVVLHVFGMYSLPST